jgi:hypothetical protein
MPMFVLVEKIKRTVPWCNCSRNHKNSGLFARYFPDNFLGAAKVVKQESTEGYTIHFGLCLVRMMTLIFKNGS